MMVCFSLRVEGRVIELIQLWWQVVAFFANCLQLCGFFCMFQYTVSGGDKCQFLHSNLFAQQSVQSSGSHFIQATDCSTYVANAGEINPLVSY